MHVPDPPESTEPEGLKELKKLRDEAKAAWLAAQTKLGLAEKTLDTLKEEVAYDTDDEEEESDDEDEDSKDQSRPSMYSQKRLVEELGQKAKVAEHEFHIKQEQVERALQELHKPKDVVTLPPPPPPPPPLLSRAEQLRVTPLTSMLEYAQPLETPQPVPQQNVESRTPTAPQSTPERKKDNLKELVTKEKWDITHNNEDWQIKIKKPPSIISSKNEDGKVKVSCDKSDPKSVEAMFNAMVADLQDKGITPMKVKITASNEEVREQLENLCTTNGVEIVPSIVARPTPSSSRLNESRQVAGNPEGRASAQVDQEEHDTSYRRR